MHYQTKGELIFAIIFVTVCVSFVWSINTYEEWVCNNYEEVTSVETKFIAFDGCYAKEQNGWVKRD